MRLPPVPSSAELLRLYRVQARKQLSQNFLLDARITDKFVRASGLLRENDVVLEVGPGPGTLTRSILQSNVGHVVAVEKDRRFLPMLQVLSEAAGGRLTIVHNDILTVDLRSLSVLRGHLPTVTEPRATGDAARSNVHIIGNLPFNIATPLLMRWLASIGNATLDAPLPHPASLTLCFQKEVAERMVARPCTAQRTRLSVMTQAFCDARMAFTIPGGAFVPPPKVDASVVALVPHAPESLQVSFDVLEVVARGLFTMRRKTVFNNARAMFGGNATLAGDWLTACHVSHDARPQELTQQECVTLALQFKAHSRRDCASTDCYRNLSS